METKKMSIYAEALADNRDYKNARIDGKTVGVREYRMWKKALADLRKPAYAIRQYRHDTMMQVEDATPADTAPFFTALHAVLSLIGEVNGAKINAANCAEEIIAQASRIRVIDITPEMAHARLEKRVAKREMGEDENEDTIKAYEDACAEVERLEGEAGNCRKLFEIQAESAFIKAVEVILGDAIIGQTMKTLDEVMAEEEARRQARRAATKAKRAAKKAQANA